MNTPDSDDDKIYFDKRGIRLMPQDRGDDYIESILKDITSIHFFL